MPTYRELLESPLWKNKRKVILERDKFTCRHCNNNTITENHISGIIYFNREIKDSNRTEYLFYSNDKIKNSHVYLPPSFNQNRSNLFVWSFIVHESNVVFAARLESKLDSLELEARKSETLRNIAIQIIEAMIKQIPDYSDVDLPSFIAGLDQKDVFDISDWLYVGGLQVHHKYYQDGKLPWEYPASALTTLCLFCHEELHKNQKVIHKDKAGKDIGFVTPCNRCHGTGYLPEYYYNENGICFTCNGARYLELK